MHSLECCHYFVLEVSVFSVTYPLLCRAYHVKLICLELALRQVDTCNISHFQDVVDQNIEAVLPGVGAQIRPVLNTCKGRDCLYLYQIVCVKVWDKRGQKRCNSIGLFNK